MTIDSEWQTEKKCSEMLDGQVNSASFIYSAGEISLISQVAPFVEYT